MTPGGSAGLLATLLGSAGVTHLVRPGVYAGLIPRRLGAPLPWVLASGVAELAVAAAIVHPRTRRPGGLAAAALLVAVLPGNVTMAVRSGRRPAWQRVVAWVRLPVQVPLVLWALSVARSAEQRYPPRARPRLP